MLRCGRGRARRATVRHSRLVLRGANEEGPRLQINATGQVAAIPACARGTSAVSSGFFLGPQSTWRGERTLLGATWDIVGSEIGLHRVGLRKGGAQRIVVMLSSMLAEAFCCGGDLDHRSPSIGVPLGAVTLAHHATTMPGMCSTAHDRLASSRRQVLAPACRDGSGAPEQAGSQRMRHAGIMYSAQGSRNQPTHQLEQPDSAGASEVDQGGRQDGRRVCHRATSQWGPRASSA